MLKNILNFSGNSLTTDSIKFAERGIDNEIVRFDGDEGKVIQGSKVFIDDTQGITGVKSLTFVDTNTTEIIPDNPTTNIVITLPKTTDKLVGRATTDSLTNKTIIGNTNTVQATALRTATGAVVVSTATAPSSGQVLTASSSSTASWVSPPPVISPYTIIDYVFDMSPDFGSSESNLTLNSTFIKFGKVVSLIVPGITFSTSSGVRAYSSISMLSPFPTGYNAPDGSSPTIALITKKDGGYDSDVMGRATIVGNNSALNIWKESSPGTGTFDGKNQGWESFSITYIAE